MADFKIVISDPKTGKSFQQEVKENAADAFMGKRIGDKVNGEVIDYSGYEFEITGGSDDAGFPMRKDVSALKKKILAIAGVGLKAKRKGQKQRKTVAGNTVHDKTAQINLKIIKYGKAKIGGEEEAPAAEAAPEEKKE